MLSPTSHHRETTSATPSQLRNVVAGLWSSVVTTTAVPNHGIPVPTNYEKLLDKHSAALQQLKLSDNEIADIIEQGFHRLQENLRECRAQTNATVQQMGMHMMRELHEDIRLEKAQAMVLQKRKVAVNAGDQKFRIAQELAEARIKARQALNLDSLSKDEEDSDEEENHEEEEEESMPQTISPTSVADAAFVQLTPQQKQTLKLEEDDDDDIKELES